MKVDPDNAARVTVARRPAGQPGEDAGHPVAHVSELTSTTRYLQLPSVRLMEVTRRVAISEL